MTKRKSSGVRKAKQNANTRVSRSGVMLRGLFGLIFLFALFILAQPGVFDALVRRLDPSGRGGFDTHGGILRGDAELAPLFTAEVLYWSDYITRWGEERSINPNLIATLMQIESCGHPYISSGAGAQGLFQVMPLHFEDGENQIQIETNALRGMNHLRDCLGWSDYDVGRSMGCYNAGPWVIYRPLSEWPQETRNYYNWGMGIFNDASRGLEESPTLNEWLNVGGSQLCERARNAQQQVLPFVISQP